MMLYTKNAINVFNVALIAPVARAAANQSVFGDNSQESLFNSFKNSGI
jgi:hypothetical protein